MTSAERQASPSSQLLGLSSSSMKHPYIQIEELEEKIKERKAVGDFDTALEGRIRQVALRMILCQLHGAPVEPLIQQHLALAKDYCENGYMQQAEQHVGRAETLNKLHVDSERQHQRMTVEIAATLGHVLFAQQHVVEAYNKLDEAERGCKDVLRDKVLEAQMLEMKGRCAAIDGDYARASEDIENAYMMREETLGHDHEETIKLWCLMADLHNEEGKQADAIDKMRTAVDKLKAKGDQPVALLDSLVKLASWQAQFPLKEGADEFESTVHGDNAALETLLQAIPVAQSHLGEDHHMVIKTKRDIALLHKKLGQLEEAVTKLSEVEELERRAHGDMSAEVGKTLKELGAVHLKMEKFEEAEAALWDAQTIMKSHSFPQGEMRMLARMLKQAGDRIESSPGYRN
eukprot:gene832-963_t